MKKSGEKKKGVEGSKPKVGKLATTLTLPALRFAQNKHTLYAFTAPARTLFEMLSINRRVEDKNDGYQRVLSATRVAAVKRYIAEGGAVPGAIVISLSGNVSYAATKKELTLTAGTDVGWVLDGQHRLAGANVAALGGKEVDLAVIAFVGLDITKQVQQFVTINREAKNVPTSLYYDLLPSLPPTKSPADMARERAIDIATQLRRDEEGPLADRIAVLVAPRSDQISLVNFTRKVMPFLSKAGILVSYSELEQTRIVRNYFEAIRLVFPKEYGDPNGMIFKTIGFGALSNLFPVVFSLALQHHSGFAVKDAVSVLKNIEGYDFSTLRQAGTGDQAERVAGEEFKAALLLAYELKGNSGGVAGALRLD